MTGTIIVLFVFLLDNSISDNRQLCDEICESHSYEKHSYKPGAYNNPICICKDHEGKLYTFTI